MKRPFLACRLLLVGLVCLAMFSGLRPIPSAGAFALSVGSTIDRGTGPRNQSDQPADADSDVTPTPEPAPEQAVAQETDTSQEPEPGDASDAESEADPAENPQEEA